ncbi:MAG TPA: hypothetical protein VE690_02990 [Rhodopila sp.]|jgi:hypothetical protein|nr:hypothetical protein [Rhodopila sp.]
MRCLRPFLLLGAVILAACEARPPLTGQAQADAETRVACEQRAEAVYNQQNRADIYSPAPSVNTPFSANYLPGQSDRGLSQLFAHDRLVSDCIRNKGSTPLPAPAPPPPANKAPPSNR